MSYAAGRELGAGIEFTEKTSSTPIYIMVDHIMYFKQNYGGGTEILLRGSKNPIFVQESYQEVA